MLRWLWIFLLVALGGTATVVQLDRHAYTVPAYAKYVPARLSNFALFHETVKEIETGTPKQAVSDARRLVINHPVPAEALTILALAEYRARNEELSSKAVLLSAQRGWREPLAQKAVAISAAQAGQWDVAADRLLALWKTSGGDSDVRDFSQTLLAQPEMQTHFAQRLVGHGDWATPFVDWAAGSLPPEAFVNVIESANRSGARFPCDRILSIARRMLDGGLLRFARRLWASQCGVDQRVMPSSDTSFGPATPGRDPEWSPFAWQFPSAIGLAAKLVDEGPKGVTLAFENTEPLRQVLARKYLALAPGTYALSYSAQSLESAERPLLAELVCTGPKRATVFNKVTVSFPDRPATFQIPARDCAVQMLRLRVAKGSGQGIKISLQ